MTWYRVRLADDRFLGFGPGPTVYTHGMVEIVPVPEPEAQCFTSPREAAEAALMGRFVPFTVEARTR